MWRIIKRTLLVVVVLIALGIGYLIAYENSEKFSTTIVSLECTLTKAHSEEFRLQALEWWGATNFARLKNDWMRGDVLLYWVEEDIGESESGLQNTVRLKEDTKFYYGVEYEDMNQYAHRSFNRNTLVYRREERTARVATEGTSNNWIERQCKIIPDKKFDKLRDDSAAATKAMQKI